MIESVAKTAAKRSHWLKSVKNLTTEFTLIAKPGFQIILEKMREFWVENGGHSTWERWDFVKTNNLFGLRTFRSRSFVLGLFNRRPFQFNVMSTFGYFNINHFHLWIFLTNVISTYGILLLGHFDSRTFRSYITPNFSTSPLKPLNGIQRNMTGSKISTSSTNVLFTGRLE